MDPNVEITPELLQANPGLAFCLVIMMGVLICGGLGAIGTWIWLTFMLARGKKILPTQTWQPRPWGLSELVLTACCLFATQFLLMVTVAPALGLDRNTAAAQQAAGETIPLSFQAIAGSAYLLTVLMLTIWICIRFAKSPAVLGWSLRGLPRNILVGVLGGLAFLPLLFIINIAVTVASDVQYEHPLFEAMESDGSGGNYLLAVFAAVIVAPFAEEFFFRVLLQGWLQSIPFIHPIEAILGKVGWSDEAPQNPTENAVEVTGATTASNSVPNNPYEPASVAPPQAEILDDAKPPIWPSIVAGTLFGLAHWGYGLSFIPLIVMGIFLGLLYRATQSIWPCIIVHFMLNATAMGALGITIYMRSVTG
ncbi:MAG: type II CAAX endopeptidase family protein [Planctomycetota bacterium]|nr:type II CAAX endopeptidase family protein [Planctomycetota bacterium]